jgi:hypothetical protein
MIPLKDNVALARIPIVTIAPTPNAIARLVWAAYASRATKRSGT